MTPSRISKITLALLVFAGAALWVHHNLRREEARPPAAPSAFDTVPTRVSADAVAPAPPTPVSTSPSLPSLGAVLAPSHDAPAVVAGLSRLVLDSTRSADERTEAMNHLLNLTAGDPAPALLPLLRDARLGAAECAQILDDSLNGSLVWQAHAHLAVLSHRKTPDAIVRAREHLVFILDVDHGEDLVRWAQAITSARTKWLTLP